MKIKKKMSKFEIFVYINKINNVTHKFNLKIRFEKNILT